MTTRPSLTRMGLVMGAACLVSYGVAVVLDWREFAGLAVGFGVVVAIALPYVAFGSELELERSVAPGRVEVGRPAQSVLTMTNASRRRSSPRVVEDVFGDTPWHHDVPALSGGESAKSEDRLPTGRRGVFRIGPATIVKTDPLGILRRSFGRAEVSQLWVYPRSVPLGSLRSGFAKDLEGPTSDTSPAGDVAFHTIREYSDGDDIRHVHWLSTAKTGTLMVRHYVDNRRPYLGVLVDSDPDHISEAGFEAALEIAASQVRSAELDGRPVAVVVGDQDVMTPQSPIDTDGALDRLCLSALDRVSGQPDKPSGLSGRAARSGSGPVDRFGQPNRTLRTAETDGTDGSGGTDGTDGTDGASVLSARARRLRATTPGLSALLIVTGPRSAADLLAVVDEARRHVKVVVARIVPEGTEPIQVPGARVLDCQDLDGFAAAWRRVVG